MTNGFNGAKISQNTHWKVVVDTHINCYLRGIDVI